MLFLNKYKHPFLIFLGNTSKEMLSRKVINNKLSIRQWTKQVGELEREHYGYHGQRCASIFSILQLISSEISSTLICLEMMLYWAMW